MLIDRGKVLREAVYKYSQREGIPITKIAERADYDQSMPYRHFKNPTLAAHIMQKYGRVIGHDFSEDIPELKAELNIMQEDPAPYHTKKQATKNLDECIEERDTWRDKYYALLEKHNAMLLEKLQSK